MNPLESITRADCGVRLGEAGLAMEPVFSPGTLAGQGQRFRPMVVSEVPDGDSMFEGATDLSPIQPEGLQQVPIPN